MAQLVFIDGQNMGTSVVLASQSTLGRSPDNTIVIPDSGIAAKAAMIRYRDGEFRILRSDPKVRLGVNGRDVAEEVLRHGDILQVGHVTLLFSDEAGAKPADYVDTRRPDKRPDSPVVESRVKTASDAESVLKSFRQSARLQQHLETLYRISAAVGGTLSLDALAKTVVDITDDVFKSDRVFLLLYDEVGDLRVAGQKLTERCQLRGFVRVSNSIINEVLESGNSLLTRDAAADGRFSAGMSIVDQQIQGAMASPMVKGERVLGAIYVDWMTSSRRFAEEDLALLNGIAMQAALAIENVQSYERQIEYSRKLIHLGETARRISSLVSPEHPEVLPREAVESAARIFDATKCTLLLFDEKEKVLRVNHSLHIARDQWDAVRVAPGDGFVGRVFKEGLPILGSTSTPDEKYETGSFLVVPVFSRADDAHAASDVVGVLCVTDKRSRRLFDSNDEELLMIFASQVGIAVHNSRLFEKATVNRLTRLFTREYFFARLEEQIADHRSRSATLGVLMVDLDHFHNVNLHGHHVGDVVLAATARVLRERIASTGGISGRYGGEEFVAYVPNAGLGTTAAIAEEVRREIEALRTSVDGKVITVTTSVGVAELAPADTAESVVKNADMAMLRAKADGRNRVTTHRPA
jgi:diguanylate cyclase (GGDEF)-like protein